MWFSDESEKKTSHLGHSGKKISGVQLTYEMLIGKGEWEDTKKQAALTCGVIPHIPEAVFWASKRLMLMPIKGKLYKYFSGSFQALNRIYWEIDGCNSETG